MIGFVLMFLLLFVSWVIFTASFDIMEIAAGAIISFVLAGLLGRVMSYKKAGRFLHPIRIGAMVFYVIQLVREEIKCHLDVGYRVITGRIKPALVEFPTDLRSELGRTILGNSITVTPGTLTIRGDNKFLIHELTFSGQKPGAVFEKLGRMIAE
jgi:multicomponent Na+:H+ antiporter subunit E